MSRLPRGAGGDLDLTPCLEAVVMVEASEDPEEVGLEEDVEAVAGVEEDEGGLGVMEVVEEEVLEGVEATEEVTGEAIKSELNINIYSQMHLIIPYTSE